MAQNIASSYEDFDPKSKYVGDRPLPIVASGEWPETLLGGEWTVLNEMYNNFLNETNLTVQLCFKRLGIFSFGGFGASADTEGNAALFDSGEVDTTFDSPTKIRADGLETYMMIPINPEEISVNYQIDTNKHQTIFFSELATLSGLKLRRFKIDSFFPYRMSEQRKYGTEPIYRPVDYIKWITECMDNKVILAFRAFGELAEPLPYMKCFIEDFQTTLKPNGEVAYSLSICEYIDYRDGIDTRMFFMNGETLIVSPKENQRDDGKIGIGDLVRVETGSIYSDKLKHSQFCVGNVVNSFFRYPPLMFTSRLMSDKADMAKYVTSYQIAGDLGSSVIYNLANWETVEWIAEMIKAKVNADRTEVWMVVGGDYFSKYRDLSPQMFSASLQQIRNFVLEASPQNTSHTIKIRSMKDNRIGWVDMKQLVKVNAMAWRATW